MKKILLIATIAFTMNVAHADMFSDGKCLSDTRMVAKHLQKLGLPKDEIRETLGDTRIHLLLNVECLPYIMPLSIKLLDGGLTQDEAIDIVGGRLAYALDRMLDDLFK